MPENALPDEVPEVGFILIQLGLDETGIVPGYNYDGMTPEAAIGYLMAFADMIREDLRVSYSYTYYSEDEDGEEGDDEVSE